MGGGELRVFLLHRLELSSVLRIFLTGRAKNEENELEASVCKGPMLLVCLFPYRWLQNLPNPISHLHFKLPVN